MTESTAAEPVRFELVTPHIALVTLDRPEKRNAINPETANALEAIVRKIEVDPAIRVAILASSQPRVFCAGADLGAVAAGKGAGLETPGGGFAGFVYAQRIKPWIAAVEGVAVAGGFELCLACDMIVASHDARFGLPETKRGLMAAAGGIHRIANMLPRPIAAEFIATGEQMDAARAFSYGLLNRLVAPGEALATALALAESIAVNAPLAVQYSLAAMRASIGQSDGTGRAFVAERLAALRGTEDFKEGPRAFVEKREPVWTGR
jgi:enoyl-CoA hydratase/carnithine racemase